MTTPAPSFRLFNLPFEIHELIIAKLPPLEIVRCRQVSKAFLELIDNSAELQLRIELAVDGLLLNHRGHIPAHLLLRQVLDRRRALEELKPQQVWSQACSDTGAVNFEICDGIWAHCIDMSSNDTFRGVHYEELISPDDYKERWTLDIHDLDINATDFSFFAGEDAQILMEMGEDNAYRRIHFRTMSDNSVHPKAAAPFLDIQKSECEVWENCSTIGNGEYLLLMFSDWDDWANARRGGGLILSWKQARVIMAYRRVADVAFLPDGDNVLLMINDIAARELPRIDLYSLSEGQRLCQFRVPFTGPVPFAAFLTHPVSHYGDNCPSLRAKMFVADPDLDIVGAVFYVRTQFGTSEYLVILSVRRLLRLAEGCKDKDAPIPYEDWSSAIRWFPPNKICHAGFRSTYGSQLVAMERKYGIDGHWVGNGVALFDFNDRPIRRKRCKSELLPQIRSVVVNEDEPTRDALEVEAPLYSNLPFRAFISHGYTSYLSIFLDGNTMIGRTNTTYDFFSFLPDIFNNSKGTQYGNLALYEAVDNAPVPPTADDEGTLDSLDELNILEQDETELESDV